MLGDGGGACTIREEGNNYDNAHQHALYFVSIGQESLKVPSERSGMNGFSYKEVYNEVVCHNENRDGQMSFHQEYYIYYVVV